MIVVMLIQNGYVKKKTWIIFVNLLQRQREKKLDYVEDANNCAKQE